MVNLETTNWLIGVIAVATALQTLIILGAAFVGFRAYRQMQTTIADLESRHIEPLRHRVDDILEDVQTIAARVSNQTERVDRAITGTIDRVDETTERVLGALDGANSCGCRANTCILRELERIAELLGGDPYLMQLLGRVHVPGRRHRYIEGFGAVDESRA